MIKYKKWKKVIERSGLFDYKYYLFTYPDVRASDMDPVMHYIKYGAQEGRNPNVNFNTTIYYKENPDVLSKNINPLVHYILHRKKENIYMSWKLNLFLNNLRLVMRSIRVNGVLETTSKIKTRLNSKRDNQVHDLIALKPVDNKWRSVNELKHKFDISVIIPTYNRASILEDLLDSWREVNKVTKYTYEIIFSDDGSTDETIDILKSSNDLPIKIVANKHGGAAKARNAAILAAEGEKILIIGDDIFPNKYLLNQHYEKLKELDVTDAVLGECVWHPALNVNHLMDHITEIGLEQFSFSVFRKHDYTDFRHFYTCNISIDREFLLSEKLIFDESFYKVNFEDIELGYRLANKGMKIYYYPKAKGEHLHSYNDVNKFCIRQETAGEMAIVFQKLHREIDAILQIESIVSNWQKYTTFKDGLLYKCNLYDELISFCQFIEDHNETKSSDLSANLSTIYGALFRFAYEKGICQQKLDVREEFLNSVLINNIINSKIIDAILCLNKKCNVPNFNKLSTFVTNDNIGNMVLTVEVEDQEQLDMLMGHFSEFEHSIQYRFKSETVIDGFVYRPKKGFLLSTNALKQIVLFLQKYKELDFVLLSFGLFDLPKIGLANVLSNSLISRDDCVQDDLFNLKTSTKGKIIRIIEDIETTEVELSEITGGRDVFLDKYGFFSHMPFEPKDVQIDLCQFGLKEAVDKPLVFIFPIFLAVGGVERNTLGIINNLKSKYNFVVINFERLNEELGSLHPQFLSSCKAIYDLTELSIHDDILCYLSALKEVYNPSLIWICNGSPWLASNTLNIRELFTDCAIVDQQVYDVKEGWINIFDDIGIHSFDRFIAINSKIQTEFIKGRRIDESKVDLIHPVVKSERFDRTLYNSQKNELAEKYGISLKKKNFVFVGRMAEQKRPLLFLDMVVRLHNNHKDCHFIMVGDGPLSDKVNEFIDKSGLDIVHRIKFIENVAELYALVDGLIITSKFEGLPIAMLEAMCMGLPVFSTNVGDVDIVLDEYKSGMLVPVDSTSNELADEFINFEKNLNIYQKYADACAENVRKIFSETVVSERYVSCFQKALKDVIN